VSSVIVLLPDQCGPRRCVQCLHICRDDRVYCGQSMHFNIACMCGSSAIHRHTDRHCTTGQSMVRHILCITAVCKSLALSVTVFYSILLYSNAEDDGTYIHSDVRVLHSDHDDYLSPYPYSYFYSFKYHSWEQHNMLLVLVRT
jgi:hypothetical protein